MKCPECVAAGLTSRVFCGGGGYSTDMCVEQYHDEGGVHHYHDPNSHMTPCTCSNGHTWTDISQHKCPACDYGDEELIGK